MKTVPAFLLIATLFITSGCVIQEKLQKGVDETRAKIIQKNQREERENMAKLENTYSSSQNRNNTPKKREEEKINNVEENPRVTIENINDWSTTEWKRVLQTVVSVKTKMIKGNEIFMHVTSKGFFPFWVHNGQMIIVSVPFGDELEFDTVFMEALKKYPSIDIGNPPNIIDLSPLNEIEKKKLKITSRENKYFLDYIIPEIEKKYFFSKIRKEKTEEEIIFIANYLTDHDSCNIEFSLNSQQSEEKLRHGLNYLDFLLLPRGCTKESSENILEVYNAEFNYDSILPYL